MLEQDGKGSRGIRFALNCRSYNICFELIFSNWLGHVTAKNEDIFESEIRSMTYFR